jgi:hypothetical protein
MKLFGLESTHPYLSIGVRYIDGSSRQLYLCDFELKVYFENSAIYLGESFQFSKRKKFM